MVNANFIKPFIRILNIQIAKNLCFVRKWQLFKVFSFKFYKNRGENEKLCRHIFFTNFIGCLVCFNPNELKNIRLLLVRHYDNLYS